MDLGIMHGYYAMSKLFIYIFRYHIILLIIVLLCTQQLRHIGATRGEGERVH
jgi:hypothetical protein